MPAVVRPLAAGMIRSRRSGSDRARRDNGAAAVEMALVLPLLLFVLFGVIDFGRMLNAQITLTEAAREGARAAVLAQPNDKPTQQSAAEARVRVATAGIGGVPGTVTTFCPQVNPASAYAAVTATTNFSFVTPLAALASLFGGSMGSSVTLTGKGVMPCVG